MSLTRITFREQLFAFLPKAERKEFSLPEYSNTLLNNALKWLSTNYPDLLETSISSTVSTLKGANAYITLDSTIFSITELYFDDSFIDYRTKNQLATEIDSKWEDTDTTTSGTPDFWYFSEDRKIKFYPRLIGNALTKTCKYYGYKRPTLPATNIATTPYEIEMDPIIVKYGLIEHNFNMALMEGNVARQQLAERQLAKLLNDTRLASRTIRERSRRKLIPPRTTRRVIDYGR